MGVSSTSWKPGQSGNPKGRPVGSGGGLSLAKKMAERLVQEGAEDSKGNKMTLADALVHIVVAEAVKGEKWAVKLAFDYIDGKPISRDKQSGVEGRPIRLVFGEEDAGL